MQPKAQALAATGCRPPGYSEGPAAWAKRKILLATVMDHELSADLSIDALTRQFTTELAHRTQAVMERAHAEIASLRAELQQEREQRQQCEARLRERDQQLQQALAELQAMARARRCAEQEVADIHAAIAAQLEHAEAEHAAAEEAAAHAEAQRLLELAHLRQELSQEFLSRDLLQRRVEALRRAASDLLAEDFSLAELAGDRASINGALPTALPLSSG